jgi:RNAse (barnase) inhibitor barstar
MAVWRGDEQTVDWELARQGPITKFYSREILNDATDWLDDNGYRVVELTASDWLGSEEALHDDVAAALDFPSYYGDNLDALDDCLSDVGRLNYGWSETDTGLVLVLLDFGSYYAQDKRLAHAFIDIYAKAAQHAALLGNRMLCLVQSDDPRLDLGDVRGTNPEWNQREWLDSARGV